MGVFVGSSETPKPYTVLTYSFVNEGMLETAIPPI